MRKTLSIALTLALVATALPAQLFAAGRTGPRQQVATGTSQEGNLSGVAQSSSKGVLPNHTVQVREVGSGNVVGTTTSSQAGTFTFTGLKPGSYIVEIVDSSGKVVGLSSAVAVGAGTTAAVTVTASSTGAMAAASGGGFSMLGLGATAAVAVIGAVGAVTAFVAVKAVKDDASPSR